MGLRDVLTIDPEGKMSGEGERGKESSQSRPLRFLV